MVFNLFFQYYSNIIVTKLDNLSTYSKGTALKSAKSLSYFKRSFKVAPKRLPSPSFDFEKIPEFFPPSNLDPEINSDSSSLSPSIPYSDSSYSKTYSDSSSKLPSSSSTVESLVFSKKSAFNIRKSPNVDHHLRWNILFS